MQKWLQHREKSQRIPGGCGWPVWCTKQLQLLPTLLEAHEDFNGERLPGILEVNYH